MDGKVLSHVRGAVSSHRSFVSGDRSGSKLKANVLLAAIYPLTNCPNDFSLIDVVLSFLSTSCAHKIMEAKSQITAVRREIKLFFFLGSAGVKQTTSSSKLVLGEGGGF